MCAVLLAGCPDDPTDDTVASTAPETEVEPAADVPLDEGTAPADEGALPPDEGPAPDPGPDIPPLCEPGQPKGECGGPIDRLVCNAAGDAFDMETCPPSTHCYVGECVDYICPPNGTRCAHPKQLEECMQDEEGTWGWVSVDDCGDGICKNGECAFGCDYNMKLNDLQDCSSWELELTPDKGTTCTADKLLAVPSSAANTLVVFDIEADPPVALAGSPFPTCKDPSRILLDGLSDVVAACRGDGKIQKHHSDGTLVWSTTLPGCTGARGVAVTPDGRLFAGCSSNGTVYELAPETGELVQEADVGGYVYGLAADETGLYVARFGFFGPGEANGVVKLHLGGADDFTEVWFTEIGVYGFALDGLGALWLGGGTTVEALDTETGLLIDSYSISSYGHGVAVGLDGAVYVGMGDKNAVARVTPGGGVEELPIPAGDKHPRGVVLDQDNRVYTINMYSSNLSRLDTVTGAKISFGNGGLLSSPYGYSGDMTGLTSNCLVGSASSWKSDPIETISFGTVWLKVNWKASEPNGTQVVIYYRIDSGPWTVASNGKPIGKSGKKAQLKAALLTDDPDVVPTLHYVAITWELPE